MKFYISENNFVFYVLILHSHKKKMRIQTHLQFILQIQNTLCACVEDNKFQV